MTAVGLGVGVVMAIVGYVLTGFGIGGECGLFDGGPDPDQEWFCRSGGIDLAIALAVLLPPIMGFLGGQARSWPWIVVGWSSPFVIAVVSLIILSAG